jgi:hypothetical protein
VRNSVSGATVRVTTRIAPTRTYGVQARTRDIFFPVTSASGSMLPVQRSLQRDLSGKSHVSLGMRKPLLEVNMTSTRPISPPKRDGNSGPEEDGDEDVRHRHGQRGVDGEGPDLEPVGEALVLAEEAGEHAGEEQRDERADDRVDDGDVDRDALDVGGEAHAEDLDALVDPGTVGEAAGDPDEHGRADRAEADGRALDDESDHDGRHGGEAEREQQRRDDGCGGAEAGGALEEAAEQPADDDGLDATVRADVREPGADRRHRAALGQGLQQEQGAEDDVEQGGREDQALDARGDDRGGAHLPHEEGHHDDDDEADRHGELGGPPEADEQHAHDGDR